MVQLCSRYFLLAIHNNHGPISDHLRDDIQCWPSNADFSYCTCT